MSSLTPPNPKSHSPTFRYGLLLGYTMLWTTHSLILHASKSESGAYIYNPTVVVLLTESLKFFVSFGLWYFPKPKSDYNPKNGTWFSAPALLYTLYNNLTFVVFLYWDPATYKILCNVRVLITAAFSVLVFKRKLGKQRWLALSGLTFALFMVSLSRHFDQNQEVETPSPEFDANLPKDPNTDDDAFAVKDDGSSPGFTLLIGLLLVFIQMSLSSFASVYNEFLFKKDLGMCLNQQNMWQYFYSVIINTIIFWIRILFVGETSGQAIPAICPAESFRFLGSCFSYYVIALIFLTAFGGLVTGAILKYLDSILKTLSGSVEMFLTAILSWLIFGIPIRAPFIIALIIASVSIYYYQTAPKMSNKGSKGSK